MHKGAGEQRACAVAKVAASEARGAATEAEETARTLAEGAGPLQSLQPGQRLQPSAEAAAEALAPNEATPGSDGASGAASSLLAPVAQPDSPAAVSLVLHGTAKFEARPWRERATAQPPARPQPPPHSGHPPGQPPEQTSGQPSSPRSALPVSLPRYEPLKRKGGVQAPSRLTECASRVSTRSEDASVTTDGFSFDGLDSLGSDFMAPTASFAALSRNHKRNRAMTAAAELDSALAKIQVLKKQRQQQLDQILTLRDDLRNLGNLVMELTKVLFDRDFDGAHAASTGGTAIAAPEQRSDKLG